MPLRRKSAEVDVSDSSFWMTTYQEHGSAVMAFLASRTGRRDVAEDLLQETFVRAIRARPTLPDPAGVRSYLFTTAHHLLLSRHRRKRPFLFSEASAGDTRVMEDMADADAPSPESVADLSRFEDRLHGVLAKLKPAYRDAFRLAVLEQKSYSEIASEQGWSSAQVKTLVHRARKQVIAALGDMLGPRPEKRS